ncbi:MAG: ABC transporter substrate-binding protein [Spirochaetales bacterium]|nr:ABC transporter substrate-binding protein [Spirochaetales bacterium]
MRKVIYCLAAYALLFVMFSCGGKADVETGKSDYSFKAPLFSEPLPDDLVWLTNETDEVFASPKAKKGGTMVTFLPSFPTTFRTVGPDSNSSFRGYIDDNTLGLVELHPDTENIIPLLATHWAYKGDNKTMYFKLNKNARWSDGVPLTAHDFAYTLKFLRSEFIVSPYYNEVFAEDKFEVVVYDDYTLAVINKESEVIQSDLFFHVNIWPTPAHYYGELGEDFIEKYNWAIVPNPGPYIISEFEKGKSVTFTRKKDWWGKDLKYLKNRFNVDKVIFKVIKDSNLTWEYFKKGELDVHGITHPMYYYDKTDIDIFHKGYANKIWFYNDTQQTPWGMFLNRDNELFKSANLRYAFAHAMNLQLVNEKILRNEYYRLEHAYVGYGKYTNNTIRARRFDLDKVNYYMKEEGWNRGSDGIWVKNGLRFSVDVTYSSDLNTQRLVVLKEEAQKAGIELKLDKLDSSAQYKKVMEKKHEVAEWIWSTKFRPVYFQQYLSEYAHKPQTNNITNTDDKDLDALIDKYRFSFDENERIALSLQVQEKLHEECSFVPWFMIPYVRQAFWRWWRLPDIPGTKSTDNLFEPFDTKFGGLFWFDKDMYDETQKAMKSGKTYTPVEIKDQTYLMEILK